MSAIEHMIPIIRSNKPVFDEILDQHPVQSWHGLEASEAVVDALKKRASKFSVLRSYVATGGVDYAEQFHGEAVSDCRVPLDRSQ